MDDLSTPIDLTDLADRAGVSVRTVRYYIQQGLLPKPEARGPGAHYTGEHLDRLLVIKRLQREHLPLGEIRRVLESSAGETKPPQSARDYIRTVLGKPSIDERIMATSRVICFWKYRFARDWLNVCIPNLSCPDCIEE